jgi:hypothetical protein
LPYCVVLKASIAVPNRVRDVLSFIYGFEKNAYASSDRLILTNRVPGKRQST